MEGKASSCSSCEAVNSKVRDLADYARIRFVFMRKFSITTLGKRKHVSTGSESYVTEQFQSHCSNIVSRKPESTALLQKSFLRLRNY